mgnify:CR=1 FL=1
MNAPLSLIDFCTRYPGESVGEATQRSVAFAQQAEALGYERIWYSEHHNMPSIASSARLTLCATG